MSTIFKGVKNSELFTLAQKFSPEFAKQTAKISADRLNLGWEANKEFATNPMPISNWFGVVMTMILNKVSIARARNVLEEYGVSEAYDTPFGNAIERLAVTGIKPVNPRFRGLNNGDSVDMYKVRKPELEQRFFVQNFDFQNFVTLQEYQIKLILQNEFGMEQITSGIMAQLENSLKKQRYLNELEALSAGINSEDFPLQETQRLVVDSWGSGSGGAVNDTDLLGFVQIVKNLAYELTLAPSSSAYNAGKFDTAVDKDEYVMLVRPEVITDIQTKLRVGAYNPEDIAMPFDIKPILNFGGLVPYAEAAFTNRLYPVYDSNGSQIGWNTSADQTTVTVQNGDEFYKDTNEDVLAVIIQKGAIFSTMQNGIQMIPTPYNAAGFYTNYWLSLVGAGVHFDYFYNMIVVYKPQTPAVEITNDEDHLTVKVGSTLQMNAETYPRDAVVTWSSGTVANATINSSTGVVTPVKAGDTVITASITVGGQSYTDTATVTVEAAS